MRWKEIVSPLVTLGALLGALLTWKQLGLPWFATQDWVTTRYGCPLLSVRRHVNEVDLYQWKHDNPNPGQSAQEQINHLSSVLSDVERQTRELGCQ